MSGSIVTIFIKREAVFSSCVACVLFFRHTFVTVNIFPSSLWMDGMCHSWSEVIMRNCHSKSLLCMISYTAYWQITCAISIITLRHYVFPWINPQPQWSAVTLGFRMAIEVNKKDWRLMWKTPSIIRSLNPELLTGGLLPRHCVAVIGWDGNESAQSAVMVQVRHAHTLSTRR